MDFDSYQQSTRETAKFPTNHMPAPIYCCMGMAGETGECLEKVKKVYRDRDGVYSPEDIEAITLELGDVLYYLASVAYEINVPLSEVARKNQEKLRSRKQRNVISGSGDFR